MKLSQAILILIGINVLYIFVNFAMYNESIDNLNANLITNFNSQFDRFDTFSVETTSSDKWYIKVTSSILGGLADAFNFVTIGLQVIGLVLGLYIKPATAAFFSENVTVLGIVGMLGAIYLWWFNIMVIMKLVKFLKGSDQ